MTSQRRFLTVKMHPSWAERAANAAPAANPTARDSTDAPCEVALSKKSWTTSITRPRPKPITAAAGQRKGLEPEPRAKPNGTTSKASPKCCKAARKGSR